MLQNIPPEITIASFSAIGILTAYIWNDQSGKIKTIKKIQNNRPCSVISAEISEIKTDIKWIKETLKK